MSTPAVADQADWALRTLGLAESHRPALEILADGGPAAEPLCLPEPVGAQAALARLGLSEVDRADTLAARPDPDRDPGVWWLLERCRHMLLRTMGSTGHLSPWPALPAELGPVGRFGYVWAFLAALPDARRYHAVRGITDDVSWSALGVLSAQMANYREIYGTGGLHTQDWLTHHFRGAIYPLRRLHFERLVVREDAAEAPYRAGDRVLALHIPEGRLTTESVDDALAYARTFFATHFPDEHYQYAICTSWVLDPQLDKYLTAETNTIQFQRRFQLLPPGTSNDNATVVEFLFKRPISELDSLPRTSTLQRGVIDHIQAGRAWQFRTGWFALGIDPDS